MPRPCPVCHHPDREKIDQLLVAREMPLAEIARSHGIPKRSMIRHRDGEKARKDGDKIQPTRGSHLIPAMAAAMVDSEKADIVERGGNLFTRLKGLEEAAYEILEVAKNSDNLTAANGSIGQLTKIFSLYVAISAEQRAQGKDDISKNPEFIEYQTLIATVLREFPGSLERLRELEGARRAG